MQLAAAEKVLSYLLFFCVNWSNICPNAPQLNNSPVFSISMFTF